MSRVPKGFTPATRSPSKPLKSLRERFWRSVDDFKLGSDPCTGVRLITHKENFNLIGVAQRGLDTDPQVSDESRGNPCLLDMLVDVHHQSSNIGGREELCIHTIGIYYIFGACQPILDQIHSETRRRNRRRVDHCPESL